MKSISRLFGTSVLFVSLLAAAACDDQEPLEDELAVEEFRAAGLTGVRLEADEPASGTKVVRVFGGSNVPSTAEIRFEPLSPSMQLEGEPSSMCNSPAAGETLVCDIPVPADPGDPDTEVDVEVRKSGSADAVRIPVTIKHEI